MPLACRSAGAACAGWFASLSLLVLGGWLLDNRIAVGALDVMMLEGNALLRAVFLLGGVYKVFHYGRNAFNISKERSKLH